MTVRINKPALNLREELTKAQGVVRYEQRQFWMDGLVENGTFDVDTSGWSSSRGGDLSVENNTLVVEGTGQLYAGASQDISTEVGKTYVISLDLASYDVGTANPRLETPVASGYITSTSFTSLEFNFVASSATTTIRISSGSVGGGTSKFKVDSISVFEVNENNNVIHSVPLGFKPVHVYEDGLLQREGEYNDYTVVDTGFEYQIKPTVAPSATTETCVIAEREL